MVDELFLQQRQQFYEQQRMQLEQMAQLRQQMQMEMEQQQNFLSRFALGWRNMWFDIQQKLRFTGLTPLSAVVHPTLIAQRGVYPWEPEYTYTPRYSIRQLFFNLNPFGMPPAEPYMTPIEASAFYEAQRRLARRALPIHLGLEGAELLSYIFGGFLAGTGVTFLTESIVRPLVNRLFSTEQIGQVRRALSSVLTRPGERALMGPSYYEAAQIYDYLIQIGRTDVLLKPKEMLDLFSKLSQTNLLLGVRSSDEFRKRFKELSDAVRHIAQNLHITFEDSINLMQQLKQFGIADPRLMSQYATMMRNAAGQIGVSTRWGATVAMGAAQTYTQMIGLAPESALQLGVATLALPRAIEQTGGKNLIDVLGGPQGAVESTQQIINALLQQPNFVQTFLGLLDIKRDASGKLTATINQEAFRRISKGTLTRDDISWLRSKAANNLAGFVELQNPTMQINLISQVLKQPAGTGLMVGFIPAYAQMAFPQLSSQQALLALLGQYLPANKAEALAAGLQPGEVIRTVMETSERAGIEDTLNRQLELRQSLWKRFWGQVGNFFMKPVYLAREALFKRTDITAPIMPAMEMYDMSRQADRFLENTVKQTIRPFAEFMADLSKSEEKFAKEILAELDKQAREQKINTNELYLSKSAALKKIEELKKQGVNAATIAGEILKMASSSIEELVQSTINQMSQPEQRALAFGVTPEQVKGINWQNIVNKKEYRQTFDRLRGILGIRGLSNEAILAFYALNPELAAELPTEMRAALATMQMEDILQIVRTDKTIRGVDINSLMGKLEKYRISTTDVIQKIAKTAPEAARGFWGQEPSTLTSKFFDVFARAKQAVQNAGIKEKIDDTAAYLMYLYGDDEDLWKNALEFLKTSKGSENFRKNQGNIKQVLNLADVLQKQQVTEATIAFSSISQGLRFNKESAQAVLSVAPGYIETIFGKEKSKQLLPLLQQVITRDVLTGFVTAAQKGEADVLKYFSKFVEQNKLQGNARDLWHLLINLTSPYLPTDIIGKDIYFQGGQWQLTNLAPEELQAYYGVENLSDLLNRRLREIVMLAPPQQRQNWFSGIFQPFLLWATGAGKEAAQERQRARFEAMKTPINFVPMQQTPEIEAETTAPVQNITTEVNAVTSLAVKSFNATVDNFGAVIGDFKQAVNKLNGVITDWQALINKARSDIGPNLNISQQLLQTTIPTTQTSR